MVTEDQKSPASEYRKFTLSSISSRVRALAGCVQRESKMGVCLVQIVGREEDRGTLPSTIHHRTTYTSVLVGSWPPIRPPKVDRFLTFSSHCDLNISFNQIYPLNN